MSKCKNYSPEYGYKYQILVRFKANECFESIDYATDKNDKNYLVNEYRLAYRGQNAEFKTIMLPEKYWKGTK